MGRALKITQWDHVIFLLRTEIEIHLCQTIFNGLLSWTDIGNCCGFLVKTYSDFEGIQFPCLCECSVPLMELCSRVKPFVNECCMVTLSVGCFSIYFSFRLWWKKNFVKHILSINELISNILEFLIYTLSGDKHYLVKRNSLTDLKWRIE